jgi:hypothetical protein
MPRLGPGRPGWRRKVESCPPIDIRKLKLEVGYSGSVPGLIRVSYFVAADNWLRLTYAYRDRYNHLQSIDLDIGITRIEQHFGGQRAWFACNGCGKRVAILYLSGPRVGCRRCLDLIYASQAERYWERAERMTKRLLAKLEEDENTIYKPKRMRWTTFEKLLARYDELQSVAEDGFLLKVARLLKRAK